IEWTIRLVDGSRYNEGRVEIYYNETWGTICDDGWSTEDADVVCRQLGFRSVAKKGAYFGEGQGTIWLRDLACDGTESSLESCTKSEWNDTASCQHFEDVGVICQPKAPDVRLVDGIKPTEGRVEYLYNGTWGTMCEFSNWRIENAQVVCRQLGLNPEGAVVRGPAYFGEGKGSIWFSRVECTGSESSLADCPHRGWNKPDCDHSEDVAVSCAVMRLVGGEKTNEGLVEIWYNNTWSEICAGSFGQTEAEIVCHHLGYNSTVIPSLSFDETQDEVRIKDVKCTGSEPMLQKCNLGLLAITGTCPTTNYAAVRCAREFREFSKPPTVRLVGGIQPYEGRIEVNYNGVWGTVCDDYWDRSDAAVVCRQLGFNPNGAEVRDYSHYGEGTGPVWLNRVECTGREDRIEDCQLGGWGSSQFSCEHVEDAAVICHPLIQLVGSKVEYEGRVEVWYNESWTGICDENWGVNEADVVCRHLGFNSEGAKSTDGGYSSEATGPIWLNDVRCIGSEKTVDDCSHAGWREHAGCDHTDDVAVTCQGVPNEVRLVGGNSSHQGRAEYFHNGEWGTICGDMFGNTEASVVCRQLGLNPQGARYELNAFFGEGTGRIWLDDLHCTGTEDHLADCLHADWGVHNCRHREDVSVICIGRI
ncbi:hypothetical protein LOTGIDRAFT_125167, partial [Lottia gigantea]